MGEIFDNSFKDGQTEDVLTAMTILSTARPSERKAYMESLTPNDPFAQQLKVVDTELTRIADEQAAAEELKAKTQ